MKPNWNCLDIWTSSMSTLRKARLMARRISFPPSSMEVGIDDVGLFFYSRNWQSWSCTWHHGFLEIPGHFKEIPGVTFSVTRFKSCWKSLVWFKEGSCMEPIKHHWAFHVMNGQRFRSRGGKKLVSTYQKCLLEVIKAKECSSSKVKSTSVAKITNVPITVIYCHYLSSTSQ